MHVGPHDPIFAGRRGGPGLPGGLTPGLRYDPTNPQGLEVIDEHTLGHSTHLECGSRTNICSCQLLF